VVHTRAGVAALVAAIVVGVFAIASPEFLEAEDPELASDDSG
jgi:hypothetical protein